MTVLVGFMVEKEPEVVCRFRALGLGLRPG